MTTRVCGRAVRMWVCVLTDQQSSWSLSLRPACGCHTNLWFWPTLSNNYMTLQLICPYNMITVQKWQSNGGQQAMSAVCRDGNGAGDGMPASQSQAKPQAHVNVNENCNCRAGSRAQFWSGWVGLVWSGLVWVGQCDNEICSRQRNGFLTLTGRVDVLPGRDQERSVAGQGRKRSCCWWRLLSMSVNQKPCRSLGQAYQRALKSRCPCCC